MMQNASYGRHNIFAIITIYSLMCYFIAMAFLFEDKPFKKKRNKHHYVCLLFARMDIFHVRHE